MSSLLVLVLTVSVLAIPGLLIVMLMRLLRGGKRVGENMQGDIDISWLEAHYPLQESEDSFLFQGQEVILDRQNDELGVWFQVLLKEGQEYPNVFSLREKDADRKSLPHFKTVPHIQIQKMGQMDNIGKRLGVEADVNTGFSDFDASVYIQTKAPKSFVQEVFASSRLRTLIVELLDEGWSTVYLYHAETAVMLKHINNNATGKDIKTFEQQLQKMTEIRSLLASFRADKVEKQISYGLAFILGGIVWAFVGMMLDGVFEPPIMLKNDMMGTYFLGGLLVSIIPFLVILRVLIGTHRALRSIFYTSLGLLAGNMFVAHMLLGHINAIFDKSTPMIVEAPIARYEASNDSEGASYYRLYIAQTEHNPRFKISVTESVYTMQPKGIQMFIGKGALGYRWLSDYELLDKKPKQ